MRYKPTKTTNFGDRPTTLLHGSTSLARGRHTLFEPVCPQTHCNPSSLISLYSPASIRVFQRHLLENRLRCLCVYFTGSSSSRFLFISLHDAVHYYMCAIIRWIMSLIYHTDITDNLKRKLKHNNDKRKKSKKVSTSCNGNGVKKGEGAMDDDSDESKDECEMRRVRSLCTRERLSPRR